jgi:hypothetical protein
VAAWLSRDAGLRLNDTEDALIKHAGMEGGGEISATQRSPWAGVSDQRVSLVLASRTWPKFYRSERSICQPVGVEGNFSHVDTERR